MHTNSAWNKVTVSDLENGMICALDLRDEAREALENEEIVWHHRSKDVPPCEVVYFPNEDRAGIVYNSGAQWGDTIVEVDESGAPTRFRLDIGDNSMLFVDELGLERCCYIDCDNQASPAQWIDSEGDCCCEKHYSQGFEYIVIASDPANALTDSNAAATYVAEMRERGWSVEVRSPRSGEADGTYHRKGDGTLQILGYSIPVPESYRSDSQDAYDAACC